MSIISDENNGVDPVSNAVDPVGNAVDPVSNAVDPVSNAVDPVSNAVDPVGNAVDPVSSAVDPVSNAVDPVSNAVDPVSNAVDPVSNAVDPVSNAVDPVSVDKKAQVKPRLGISDILAGEAKSFKADLRAYLPQDLIGGSVPHIVGFENEAVWNAACQACGTEKVHYVYSVSDGHVWYLACPSSAMASNPDSWCPMAAALPGNSEYWDRETVYLYEQEGTACALRWDKDTGRMQLFLGASRSILPRIQSMDANFVTINPDIADIVAWKNSALKTEKLSRAVIHMLIVTGLIVNLIAAVILLINIVSISAVDMDLAKIKKNTDETAHELVVSASNVMQSDAIKHMVRIQHLLDNISLSNGYLVRYEVVGKRVEWSAIIPQGLASKAIEATSLAELVSGRAKRYSAKVTGPEEGDNVRIDGKK